MRRHRVNPPTLPSPAGGLILLFPKDTPVPHRALASPRQGRSGSVCPTIPQYQISIFYLPSIFHPRPFASTAFRPCKLASRPAKFATAHSALWLKIPNLQSLVPSSPPLSFVQILLNEQDSPALSPSCAHVADTQRARSPETHRYVPPPQAQPRAVACPVYHSKALARSF